ncbi:Orotate phosphoribosyltransferase [Gimesia chilikensis]|uniref:Orotate phosphoribosyltransferase n=2 Tax=Gimesia chilikensis TaxID=2605989 RepID=A0A517PWB8_9PLAN|nr:Orotate phosphoribosyltransferase [Gimesia chilikensis]
MIEESVQNNNEYCQCRPDKYPFECKRHCMLKTKTKHEHCMLVTKNGHRFWNAWEQGGHSATAPPEPVELISSFLPSEAKSVTKLKPRKHKQERRWVNSFKTDCTHCGNVIHSEPCTCGASSKIDVYECKVPEIKRCVPLKSKLNKIKDKDAKRAIKACQGCEFYQPKIKFVSVEEFARDTLKLIPLLPDNITSVTGVARSGVHPASMIAMMLHVPLYILRQSKNDLIPAGNGWRLHQQPQGPGINLVIDDTTMTGRSLSLAKGILKNSGMKHIHASVYTNPAALSKPDLWAVDLPWPHFLEWNLFNSVMSPSIALDFDGILCNDCRPIEDDDGERYLNFLENAVPKYLPKKTSVPLIITARIEKYRPQTITWLKRWGVRYNKLVMHSAPTLQERNRDNIARYKAEHYSSWVSSNNFKISPPVFIESDDHQARKIAEYSRSPVICPTSKRAYQ